MTQFTHVFRHSRAYRDVRDVPIMTLHVSLYVVLGEQSDIDSPQLTLHVSIQVVPEFESIATQSTMVYNHPGMTCHVSIYVVSADKSFPNVTQ